MNNIGTKVILSIFSATTFFNLSASEQARKDAYTRYTHAVNKALAGKKFEQNLLSCVQATIKLFSDLIEEACDQLNDVDRKALKQMLEELRDALEKHATILSTLNTQCSEYEKKKIAEAFFEDLEQIFSLIVFFDDSKLRAERAQYIKQTSIMSLNFCAKSLIETFDALINRL